MSLISDFGDLNKDFGLRILVAAKKLRDEPETLRKLHFGPNLEKNEEMVINQENKLYLSLYNYIKLKYKIWGQSEVK